MGSIADYPSSPDSLSLTGCARHGRAVSAGKRTNENLA
jgi:hypothetical protein